MATYRYSEESVERLARQSQRQSGLMIGAAVLAGFIVTVMNSWPPQLLIDLPIFLIFSLVWFWIQNRAGKKAKALIQSTEIQLNGALTGRNSILTTTIRSDEVRQISYLKRGIVVRGRNVQQTLQLKPELQGFDELARRLEEWAPASVPRISSAVSLNQWITAGALANLGLLILAFSVRHPIAAIVLCLTEAGVLLYCAMWVWRSRVLPPRLKWVMLVTALPVVALLGRAYLIWQ